MSAVKVGDGRFVWLAVNASSGGAVYPGSEAVGRLGNLLFATLAAGVIVAGARRTAASRIAALHGRVEAA